MAVDGDLDKDTKDGWCLWHQGKMGFFIFLFLSQCMDWFI